MARIATITYLGLLLVTAGCAALRPTLAQELALERWRECDRFPTIQLKEVRPDGQIWVFYGHEKEAFFQCLRDAEKKQASRRAVAVNAPEVKAVAAPPDLAGRLNPPALKRGDEWAFKWESPRGSGTFVWTVDREETIDGAQFYVIKSGSRE